MFAMHKNSSYLVVPACVYWRRCLEHRIKRILTSARCEKCSVNFVIINFDWHINVLQTVEIDDFVCSEHIQATLQGQHQTKFSEFSISLQNWHESCANAWNDWNVQNGIGKISFLLIFSSYELIYACYDILACEISDCFLFLYVRTSENDANSKIRSLRSNWMLFISRLISMSFFFYGERHHYFANKIFPCQKTRLFSLLELHFQTQLISV